MSSARIQVSLIQLDARCCQNAALDAVKTGLDVKDSVSVATTRP